MSYNDTLTANNADLQAILDAVNALPSSGGTEYTVVFNLCSGGTVYVNDEEIYVDAGADTSVTVRGAQNIVLLDYSSLSGSLDGSSGCVSQRMSAYFEGLQLTVLRVSGTETTGRYELMY